MRVRPRGRVVFAGLGLLLAAGLAASRPPLLLVNESHSVPSGLYRRAASSPHRGDLVALRQPPAARSYLRRLGAPPGMRLLKRVAARGGDPVCAQGAGLSWPGGAARRLARDRRGARLPQWTGCRPLAGDELLLLGDTPDSFDSRYFGPVPRAAVDGVYVEILRW